MKTHERFAELWTDYLEGDLDESEMGELRELLSADRSLLEMAADLYQTHRLLGLVAAEDATRHDEFVRDTLDRLPLDQDGFVNNVMSTATDFRPKQTINVTRKAPGLYSPSIWAAIVATIVAIVGFAFWPQDHPQVAQREVANAGDTATKGNVHVVSLSHAQFFGELPPPIQSSLTPQRDYVLMEGLVEVAFPCGASAIIEGPAVFRVLSGESLAIDVGRCSVHAPEGAEGFRVETPVTRVVDRGTRFTVSVSETSETEVQVIEGAADIYRQPKDFSQQTSPADKRSQAFEVRLTSSEAKRFTHLGAFSADSIPFHSGLYRYRLPDRVVSYKATTAAGGGAKDLISVSVQRDGDLFEIPVDRLISSEVTWFKAEAQGGYLAGEATLPTRRRDTSSDRTLITGVINPGGSREPLTTDPVMDTSDDSGQSNTPGLAVRFTEPVSNGPGADVVFFELQTFTNPPDGDAFHVSPLKFKDGLKSHTIRVYDLTMESPNALDLANFYVYTFNEIGQSLAVLETAQCIARSQAIKFRGLAVGIDLSDLGYDEGESVEGLFFQDAMDDKHTVDPVFIAGLPTVEPVDASKGDR